MKQIDVLIVDDEVKFAAMLAKRLELRGCRCDVCYDGNSAIKWVKANPEFRSLILLDLQLPDIYGTQVLTQIKECAPLIPVVILTGHGNEKDRIECQELGSWQFLNKPVSIETIIEMVSEIQKKQPC